MRCGVAVFWGADGSTCAGGDAPVEFGRASFFVRPWYCNPLFARCRACAARWTYHVDFATLENCACIILNRGGMILPANYPSVIYYVYSPRRPAPLDATSTTRRATGSAPCPSWLTCVSHHRSRDCSCFGVSPLVRLKKDYRSADFVTQTMTTAGLTSRAPLTPPELQPPSGPYPSPH